MSRKVCSPFDGKVVLVCLLVFFQRFHPQFTRHFGAAFENSFEKGILVVEIVIHQCVVNASTLGDILQGHPVKSMFREEIFGFVQDLFGRLGTPFRFAQRLFSGLPGCWHAVTLPHGRRICGREGDGTIMHCNIRSVSATCRSSRLAPRASAAIARRDRGSTN